MTQIRQHSAQVSKTCGPRQNSEKTKIHRSSFFADFLSPFFVTPLDRMSQGYHTMSNVAAHAGGQQARRENFGMRRAPQRPDMQELSCSFPAPAPMRVYCTPAAFSGDCCGAEGSYHKLITAYGQSRPLQRYY